MKITLQVNGREMTFSEQELTAIVEEHLSRETTKQATTKVPQGPTKKEGIEVKTQVSRETTKQATTKVPQGPTENEWFEVRPQAIDQKLFEKKREDNSQEETRQLILEAFAEMKKNPEKYGKNFKTMMPKKTWSSKSIIQLIEMASNLGDHNADWVEQALEWAQKIANGKTWESICNDADTADWCRLVVWKNDNRLVGGAVCDGYYRPASGVSDGRKYTGSNLYYAVPLVVIYE